MPNKAGQDNHQQAASKLYAELPQYAVMMHEKLLTQMRPLVELTDSYGRLIVRATMAIGSTRPKSKQEVVVRDLIADVFDFLYEWPRPLLEGRPNVAFPLARRAYESLSLLSACHQSQSLAERWAKGKQIRNADIRKYLETAEYPENRDATKDFYKYFSTGSHPNRSLVAERFLGDGNHFTLGSIGQPSLLLIVDQCGYMIDMWFWFGAIVSHIAKDALESRDETYIEDYHSAVKMAKEVHVWLASCRTALLEEEQTTDQV